MATLGDPIWLTTDDYSLRIEITDSRAVDSLSELAHCCLTAYKPAPAPVRWLKFTFFKAGTVAGSETVHDRVPTGPVLTKCFEDLQALDPELFVDFLKAQSGRINLKSYVSCVAYAENLHNRTKTKQYVNISNRDKPLTKTREFIGGFLSSQEKADYTPDTYWSGFLIIRGDNPNYIKFRVGLCTVGQDLKHAARVELSDLLVQELCQTYRINPDSLGIPHRDNLIYTSWSIRMLGLSALHGQSLLAVPETY